MKKTTYQRLFVLLCLYFSINLFAPVKLLSAEVLSPIDPVRAHSESDDDSEDNGDEEDSDESDDEKSDDEDSNEEDDASDESEDESGEEDSDSEDESDDNESDDKSDDDNEDSDENEHEADDNSDDQEDDDGEDEESDDASDDSDEGEVFMTSTASAPAGSRVKIEIERSLSGELKLQIDVRGLPVGIYDLYVAGVYRGNIEVVATGSTTRGEVEYETIPDDSSERLLDFEILGQLVEISQGGIIYFSGIAPSVSTVDDGDSLEIDTNVEEGSTELETYIAGTEQAPETSAVKVKVERQFDGELEFDVEVRGLPTGDYDLIVSGVNRGTIAVVISGSTTSGEISFESHPDDDSERLLDFPVTGETISIERSGVVYFSGIIPIPVPTPAAVVPANDVLQSVGTALLPDNSAVVLENGWKQSSWFGVYDDSRFPIIEHCALGSVEYRFSGGRNFLVSEAYGVLEILTSVSDGGYAYFSFETGRTFTLSPTDSGCVSLNPGVFYDEDSQGYVESVVPAADDVQGFYDIAFETTQETQVKSALTIQLVQSGNLEEAIEKLTETTFYRSLAVNNANRTINAVYLTGENIEFWENAALQLIAIADEALIQAQTVVAASL